MDLPYSHMLTCAPQVRIEPCHDGPGGVFLTHLPLHFGGRETEPRGLLRNGGVEAPHVPRDPRERPLPLNQSDHGKYPSARAEIRKALKLREQFQGRKEEQKDRRPKHESFRRSKHDGGLQNDLRRMQKQDCGAPLPPHCGQKQGDQIRSGDAILTGVVDVPHLAVNRFRPTPHGPRSTMPRSKARMHLWRAVDTAASALGTIARSMASLLQKWPGIWLGGQGATSGATLTK